MIRVLVACLMIFLATPVLAGETFNYGRFGPITVYRDKTEPKAVVVFFSGPKGWNEEMADMGQALMAHGALVIGIDTPHWIDEATAAKKTCIDVQDQIELLSHYIQQKYGLNDYRRPILIDYSAGAPIGYVALAAADTGTFKGAISIGFCPTLQISTPTCAGNGAAFLPDTRAGYVLTPFKDMKSPWVNLQGISRQACHMAEAQSFINNTGRSSLIKVTRKSRSAADEVMPQLLEAFDRMAAMPDPGIGNAIPSLADLPIVEVPSAAKHQTDTFAVLITGDGGWAGIDREVSAGLAAKGIPVVGLSSLRYFWHKQTPEGAARDMQRIIEHYSNAWNKKHVLLIGYSFGADTLPFIASRLAQNYKDLISGIALIGLSDTTKFEYQVPVGNLFGNSDKDDMPTAPEINRLRGLNLLCIYGEEEDDDPCPKLQGDLIHKLVLKGGHHFNGDYDPIILEISRMAK